jgi:RTA1 like protein
MLVAVVFYLRISKQPTSLSQSAEIPWRLHMWVLFITSLLIMIRSVFRVVEYVQGTDGYLLSHEIYGYIFDALLMFAVVGVFNIAHPTQITGLLTGRGIVRKVVMVEMKGKLGDSPVLDRGNGIDLEIGASSKTRN